MTVALPWLRPDAPYMPIVTTGILAALGDAGHDATAVWTTQSGRTVLHVDGDNGMDVTVIASAVCAAPWPSLAEIPWSGRLGQAIKPMLAAVADPPGELARLRREVSGRGRVGERRLLDALVTDAVLDDQGIPSRNRLLRGVKADLSGVGERVTVTRAGIAEELSDGPVWRNGKSGRGLGLLPEVQTFGGTTGRNPSDVGSHSILLYRLLWLGILALPPVGVVRAGRRAVGGPLVTAPDVLSWPVWTCRLDLTGLRSFFSLPAIHAQTPPSDLAARGIVAVHRARAVPINSMVAVYRWGERVA